MRASTRLPTPRYWRATTALLLSMAALTAPATAQIAFDGTTGPGGALPGPDYQITDDLGTRAGDNLFHSFSEFSIGTGESATFSDPDEIANVISRVTGPNPSDIDGTLRSTMPDSDFYFINPNGVTFGPNATLDVQGSFHVSTADELRLDDGQVFSAVTANVPSGLMVAEPRAFGFFDADPGAILVDGSTLEVGEGETLSLVGGDIAVDGGEARAEAGMINLLAVGGEGEADVVTGEVSASGLSDISLTNGAIVDVSGDGAGGIQATGELIAIDGQSALQANNLGPNNAMREIRVEAETLLLHSGGRVVAFTIDLGAGANIFIRSSSIGLRNGSDISTITGDTGAAGDLSISADRILVHGPSSEISSFSSSSSSGSAGQIVLRANDLQILRGATVESTTFSSGNAGRVVVDAERILIDDENVVGGTGILGVAGPSSTGNGGEVIVSFGELKILNGGAIDSSTFASGNGGSVILRGQQIVIDDSGAATPTGISSLASLSSSGEAGDIFISADDIQITNGGWIATTTLADGNAGTITIDAGDITIDRTADSGQTGIVSIASLSSSGDAGEIRVDAGDVTILNGSIIEASTFSSGDAGTISVSADTILIDDGDALAPTGILSTASLSATGEAGEVAVKAKDLKIVNGGSIGSSTFSIGDAGSVVVDAGRILIDGGDSAGLTGILSLATTSSLGEAGDVSVTADELHIRNGGTVNSSSFGTDNAGTVLVSAGCLDIDSNGSISSDAFSVGAAGDVIVTGIEIDITDGEIRTQGQTSEGGRIRLTGTDHIVLADSLITSNGIEPQEGSSLIELNSKVIALNDSRITSLTGEGTPIAGSGVVDVDGEFTLISPDSDVEASSSVEISGVLNDFSNQLIILDSQFADVSRLLRESCESGGDLGGSTFVTSGQAPTIVPEDGLLPGLYSDGGSTDQAKQGLVGVAVPCP